MAGKEKEDTKLQVNSRKLLTCLNNKELEPLDAILQENIDFSVTDKGDAAIHLAARNGFTDVIGKFLRHGDSVNRTNQNGNIAMHYAARNGHLKTVKFLREKGSTVNAKNQDGDTPLHFAVMYQSMDFIETIVGLGMKVNTQNKKGETPLHVAVAHNRTEAMEALLINRADPDIKDKKGSKPADIAKSSTVAEQLRICGDMMAAMASGYIQAQGISVEPKQTSLRLARVGVTVECITSSEVLPYQFYCRREKTENSGIKFASDKSEEVVSDVYYFRVIDAIDSVDFEAKIPLYSDIGVKEQAVVKFIDGRMEEFEETYSSDGMIFCSLGLSVRPGCTEVFVITTKPKTEEQTIGTDGTTVQSAMEENFQLQIPTGSFNEGTKLSLKIYDTIDCAEPSTKRQKTGEVQQLFTDIYEIQVAGQQPSKDIKIQIPLLSPVSESNEVIIVAADENNLLDETSLEVIPSKPVKIGNNVSFDVSHFSMDYIYNHLSCNTTQGDGYALVKQIKAHFKLGQVRHVAVSRIMMLQSPRSVFDQIISSRDRKRPVVFFVMVLEQGLNHNIAVVECVQAEKAYKRMQQWSGKGYVRQEVGESSTFLTEPGHEFHVKFDGNVTAVGTSGLRKLMFVPRRPSFQPFRLGLQDKHRPPFGQVTIMSTELTENALQKCRDLTRLPFKVPAPPKPVNIDKPGGAAKFDIKESEVEPLLVSYLKTRFSKYPFIDEKDPELQDKIDDVLEIINVKNAPRLVIKNIFLHIQAKFAQWREGLFCKLVNNVDSVDTAAMSIDSLTDYMFEDFGLT